MVDPHRLLDMQLAETKAKRSARAPAARRVKD
jgi:hypothetical protein